MNGRIVVDPRLLEDAAVALRSGVRTLSDGTARARALAGRLQAELQGVTADNVLALLRKVPPVGEGMEESIERLALALQRVAARFRATDSECERDVARIGWSTLAGIANGRVLYAENLALEPAPSPVFDAEDKRGGVYEKLSAAANLVSLDNITKDDIDRTCLAFDDGATFAFAGLYVIKKAGLYGHAHRHLVHFLEGTGAPVRFDLPQLLKDAPATQDRIVAEIRRQWANGDQHGRVEVRQPDYHAVSQEQFDWKYAVGGFFVAWRSLPGESNGFTLAVVNDYSWHPEDRELTKCIHEAGVRLGRAGLAKEFTMLGEARMSFDPTSGR